jgi:hypothetical protein
MQAVTVTNSDLLNDTRLHLFFKDAYINNKDVIIPNELVKDFVELGCRKSISSTSPFVK